MPLLLRQAEWLCLHLADLLPHCPAPLVSGCLCLASSHVLCEYETSQSLALVPSGKAEPPQSMLLQRVGRGRGAGSKCGVWDKMAVNGDRVCGQGVSLEAEVCNRVGSHGHEVLKKLVCKLCKEAKGVLFLLLLIPDARGSRRRQLLWKRLPRGADPKGGAQHSLRCPEARSLIVPCAD